MELEFKDVFSFELKAETAGVISGYASTFAKDSQGDRIEPGAFGKSIAERKGRIPLLMYHDYQQWAGVTTTLAEDHKGLLMSAKLFMDTARGSDAYALLKNASAADFAPGLSIGFYARDTDWDENTGTRLIKEIDLVELSITPFPANKGARVDAVKSMRNYERLVRDATKCSQEEAKRVLALLPLDLSADADGRQLTRGRDGHVTEQSIRSDFRAALFGKG